MRGHEYRFINLFRALAAFWVLVAHCMIWGGWYGLPVPSAKIAVDLFMLVSGFLMASNAVARWNVEPLDVPENRLRFWVRRYFRLAPAYYLSLAMIVAGAPFFLAGKKALQTLNPEVFPPGGIYDPALVSFDWQNVLMHASFLSGVHPAYGLSASLPDWSLSLEMQFYLAFPLLFLLLRRTSVALLFGVGSLLVGVFIAARIQYPEPSLLPFKLHYFIAGMLLFRAMQGAWKPAAAALCLVSLGFDYGAQVIVAPALMLAMLVMGRMETIGSTPPWLVRIVESRTVRFASNASYAVYLFHGMLIGTFGVMLSSNDALQALSAPARVAVMFGFVGAGAYAWAYLVHRYVELPGIQLGKRVMRLLGHKRLDVGANA